MLTRRPELVGYIGAEQIGRGQKRTTRQSWRPDRTDTGTKTGIGVGRTRLLGKAGRQIDC